MSKKICTKYMLLSIMDYKACECSINFTYTLDYLFLLKAIRLIMSFTI